MRYEHERANVIWDGMGAFVVVMCVSLKELEKRFA